MSPNGNFLKLYTVSLVCVCLINYIFPLPLLFIVSKFILYIKSTYIPREAHSSVPFIRLSQSAVSNSAVPFEVFYQLCKLSRKSDIHVLGIMCIWLPAANHPSGTENSIETWYVILWIDYDYWCLDSVPEVYKKLAEICCDETGSHTGSQFTYQ